MLQRSKLSVSLQVVLVIAVIAACIGFAVPGTTLAAVTQNTISVTVDNSSVDFDVPPTIKEGRTLVPLRAIFEALGATVDWDAGTKTVTGIKDDITVSLKISSKDAYVNNNLVKIDVPAMIMGGRTLVPTRFIAESLGAEVNWETTTRTVVITSPKIIKFEDPNLESAVREELKKEKGDILSSDLKKIAELTAESKKITKLNGIENLTSLERLNLADNQISDIGALSSITGLEELSLSRNRISDISALKNLPNLNFLNLSDNQVTDISPLKGMSKLTTCSLAINQIYDISPLKDLSGLTSLYLCSNPILDITPLKGLDNLKTLYLLNFSERDTLDAALFEKYEQMSQKVQEIINLVVKPEMNDLEKELAVHDYIVTHTKYDYENFKKNTLPDESHTPYGVLIKGIGVCDGYARTLQIILNKLGIECKMVIGDFNTLTASGGSTVGGDSEVKWKHAWNIVKIGDVYYHVDVTADDPVSDDGKNILSHRYFNISDKQMGVDHLWDRAAYQSCNTDSTTYAQMIDEQKDVIISETANYYTDADGILHKVVQSEGKDTVLVNDKCSDINLSGEWIYYINESDGNKIYKIKTDGTERTKVMDDETKRLYLYSNWIFYLSNGKMNKVGFDGVNKIVFNTDDIVTWIHITGDVIYYKGFNWDQGAKIFKTDLNGSIKTTVSHDSPVGFELTPDGQRVSFTYSVTEHMQDEWIYFINASDGKKLYKIKSDGSSRSKIGEDPVEGYYTEVVGNWIYYQNAADNKKYYRVSVDGRGRQAVE